MGNTMTEDLEKSGGDSKSTLSDLLCALSKNGYRNFHKQHHGDGDLWQKKGEKGCFFNFYVYELGGNMPVDIVTAEICFECSADGQWCKHSLYGISVGKMAEMIQQTEEKLFSIFVKYDGQKYT